MGWEGEGRGGKEREEEENIIYNLLNTEIASMFAGQCIHSSH